MNDAKEMIIGRYVRWVKNSSWSSRKEGIGKYFQIVDGDSLVNGSAVRVTGNGHHKDSLACSRFLTDGEFELMPVGWKPSFISNELVNYQIC